MGLGSTAKKVQTVADIAEKLYTKVNEIRERVVSMQEAVDTTEERVERLEREVAEQRAIVEALATAEGVDVAAALEDLDRDAAVDGAEKTDDAGNADGADAANATEGTDGTTGESV
ncbi:hypothetical protein BRC97_08790 [Halobacteriales archaeon QS_6_71_20]|nr:MAG: hypothetical protein BRC97_08790 [Halobacteriales archaeon QS_6_71_20]